MKNHNEKSKIRVFVSHTGTPEIESIIRTFFAKRTQFQLGSNRRKLFIEKLIQEIFGSDGVEKRTQNEPKRTQFINVQCSAFSGLRQDEEKKFEKTKPIFERAR